MTITMFYRGTDFFGHSTDRSDTLRAGSDDDYKKALTKCLNYTKRDYLSCSFGIDFRDCSYRVECRINDVDNDVENGVYTVTKYYGMDNMNHDSPVKMTAQSIRRLVKQA